MNQPQKHTGLIRLGQRTSEGASAIFCIRSPPEGAGILLKTEQAERPTIKHQRPDKALNERKPAFGDVHGLQSSQLKGAQDILIFQNVHFLCQHTTHL